MGCCYCKKKKNQPKSINNAKENSESSDNSLKDGLITINPDINNIRTSSFNDDNSEIKKTDDSTQKIEEEIQEVTDSSKHSEPNYKIIPLLEYIKLN